MKYLIILFICLSILSCKSDREELYITTDNLTAEQVFKINPEKDTVLIGKKGTQIKLKANSFINEDGSEPKSEITILLKEFYTIEDFINNKLSTLTHDGRILNSSGMIYIEAKENNKTLELKEENPMKLAFPRIQKSNTANLFSGQKDENDIVKWSLLEPVYNDTLVNRLERVLTLSYGADCTIMTYNFIVGLDTIPYNDNISSEFKELLKNEIVETTAYFSDCEGCDSTVPIYNPESIKYYSFETSSLGYINCDFFINEKLHNLTVSTDQSNSEIYLVLENLNSLLYPWFLDDSKNEFTFSLPDNLSATVLVYSKQGEDFYYGLKKINSGASNINIKQEKTSIEKLRKRIKNLNSK